jgi:hypothetical protein
MPTFYFNVRTDRLDATDTVGEFCLTTADARSRALQAARMIVQHELSSGGFPGEGWIDVEDDDHRRVLSIPLREAAS